MTRDEVASDLAAYAAGVEAELALLRQLESISRVQQEATVARDAARMKQVVDERGRLMAALVAVEHGIAATRTRLVEHLAIASTLDGFDRVARAHRTAASIVAQILSSDRETREALRDAELARRQASQFVDTGEATLAAYRRVITPPDQGPSLLTRKG